MIALRSFFLLSVLWCGAWVHAEPEEAALCKACLLYTSDAADE